jgi:NADPH-dependent curcumin reductase CurA
MPEVNRRFLLAQRPTGRIDADTFRYDEVPVPEIGDGEALVRSEWISLDPTMRGWISPVATYLPPVGIGEVMRAGALARVVASNSPTYEVGQLVQGLIGWQEYAVVSPSAPARVMPEFPGVPTSQLLGVLGGTGLTAYVGTLDIGRPQEGETFVVSAAAGAVGTVAGQLAKIAGARVVGIAGGPAKCAMLTDELGFDAAVDYKAPDWRDQLAAATPDGIDVDFENVGGEIMEAVFARLNIGARVALCGLISGYNDESLLSGAGPANFGNLLVQRVLVQGFIVLDHLRRAGEVGPQLATWIAEGTLKPKETIVEGFEQLPTAINMLFDGANVGKLVVKV